MSNKLYTSTTFVANEIPSNTKLNQISTRTANSMQLVANALIGLAGAEGVFAGKDDDALKVVASSTPDMNVTVQVGVAAVSDTIVQCETAKVMTIVAPAVSNRYTIIQINSDGDIETKNGAEAASPTEPDPDSGFLKIAAIYLPLATASIENSDGGNGYIIDRRVVLPGHYHDIRAYDVSENGDTTTTGSITSGTTALTVTSGNTFLAGQGIVIDGAKIDRDDTGNTADANQDFSTTGNNDDREWMARKFTAVNTGRVCTVAWVLGKTGNPAGTMNAYIYSDDGGAPSIPDTQLAGASAAITNDNLSADAAGATQEFTWSSNYPEIVAGTDYWVVLKTTGYTYVDATTEVRWRTDANGAVGDNECAKYDANAGTPWTTMGADVGADVTVSVELLTSIVSISGTSIVTADSATHTATSMTVYHEESVGTQAALDRINAAGGGMLFIPAGTYRYESSVSIYSNTTILGVGEASIISLPFGDDLWSAAGTLSGTTYSLNSNANASQFDVELGAGDGSNFAADDWFRLSSDEKFDGDASVVEMELRKVDSISSDTLTCDTVLAHTYTTGNNALIAKVTIVECITISGLRFVGGGSTYNQDGIKFEYCDNLRLYDCTFIDFNERALSVVSCVNFGIHGLYVDNCQLSGYGYGVVYTDCCRDYRITDCHFKRCRHGIASGGTNGVQRHGVIGDNTFLGGAVTGPAIDQHHSVEHLVIANNTTHGQALAAPSGIHLVFEGNIIRTAGATAGINIWTDARDLKVMGNKFDVSEYGIAVGAGDVTNVEITDNVFVEAAEAEATTFGIGLVRECVDLTIDGNVLADTDYGVYIRNTSADADSTNIAIRNNTFRNIGTTPIDVKAEGGQDMYHVQIVGNMVEVAGGQRGIYVFDDNTQKVSGLLIDDNYVEGGHTGIEIGGANVENWHIGESNVVNGASATPVEVGANVNGGTVGIMARATASLDLSGAAVDNEIFIAPDNCCLVMYDIVYTEASSADAGVNIRIGRYQDGVALDDDYFDVTTSEVSQNLGAKTRVYTASLTQYQLTAGDVVTVGTAGSKTGTGEVMLVLYFCLSAQ